MLRPHTKLTKEQIENLYRKPPTPQLIQLQESAVSLGYQLTPASTIDEAPIATEHSQLMMVRDNDEEDRRENNSTSLLYTENSNNSQVNNV